MQIIIAVNGKEYRSKESNGTTAEDACQQFFDYLDGDSCKFKMELEGGDFILLGKQSLQNAVMLFKA